MPTLSQSGPIGSTSTVRIPPAPKQSAFLGHLPILRSDPLANLLRYSREGGKVMRIRLGWHNLYFLNHPDCIAHVLQNNYKNYTKRTRGWNSLRPLFGEGLLTSDGQKWLHQRRTMQPAFHRNHIGHFLEIFVRQTRSLLERWEGQENDTPAINIAEEMMSLTFRIVTETLFSGDARGKEEIVGSALTTILRCAAANYYRIVDIPLWIPTSLNRKAVQSLKVLDKIVYEIIAKRRKNGNSHEDLLSLLMSTKDPETGRSMTDEELRDQVLTIFMTGHETTAVALTWTWYLLSKSPEVERRLAEEIQTVIVDGELTLESLRQLRLTKAVFKETLRLYPPIWIFSRKAVEEDSIGGYRIPAGGTVFFCPFAMHRNTSYFDNPEGFDPWRFLDGTMDQLPPFAYFPFGGGPRLCIGRDFALMEAAVIIPMIAQKFRLQQQPGHRAEPEPSITLRPRYGMMMHLTKK